MATVLTDDEIGTRLSEIKVRVTELDAEFAGQAFPDEQKEEWNALHAERETLVTLKEELSTRRAEVEKLASPQNREAPSVFQTARAGRTDGEDIYDLSTIRSSMADPERAKDELNDRAKRSIESATFPNERANKEDCQAHVERLLGQDDGRGTIARRILGTGSPLYKRAFGKMLAGGQLSNEERSVLSLTTTEGGFAVPYVLDPTVIPTSNSSVNPYRAISRVISIPGNTWNGVSSAGVTAAYAAETTEAGADAPTLAQPTITVEKAQAFIPFSIEVGEDWGGLQAEMAKMLQDAKDDLEADKFSIGDGSDEPYGVVTGATNVTDAGSGLTLVVADLFKCENELPPRFRPRASWLADRPIYNRIRQFDTAGGASLWKYLPEGLNNQVPTPGNTGATILGYPANECSAVPSTFTNDLPLAVFGDFSYFAVVDRVGLNVELIPHLFATGNNRPSGSRGLYAYWRNSSKVLSAAAFTTLVATT